MFCPKCHEENPERSRFCWSCGTALTSPLIPTPEVRKTVTVVFCDVTGSTALGERLDAESLHRVMAGYYLRMREVLELHGGTVREFLGDAVMAVFGVPVVHEDDPIRAVRAAVEMAEAIQRLNATFQRSWGVTLQVHTGVNTGEVVAGDPFTSDTLVVGDAVNVAARLEEAASPGEILLGPATYRLVGDAIQAEPVGPLTLKGKEAPVPAWRLLHVAGGTPGHVRDMDSPIVGREEELALLEQAFRRAARERRCFLFTLLGSAGVGKSRLVAEFVAKADTQATVLRGRCLSYGEGITFWPIAEVVRQAGDILDRDPPETARRKLAGLLDEGEQSPLVTEPLAGMLGLTERPTTAAEMLWAIRRLFEALARRRPLIIVFDDLQWAEPTFLEVIEHVADWSRAAPLLLLCVAREEFLDAHPNWGGGKLNATSILLEPLSTDESGRVATNFLAGHLADDAQRRILDVAEGNPLFIEEFLRMLLEDGLLAHVEDRWAATADLNALPIPASIQALLAARLERLDSEERATLQRASIIGKVFDQEAVGELSPAAIRPAVSELLLALVRKELIRPDHSGLAGQDGFGFRHDLIRDAAAESLPKQHRAELHERLAGWLERRVADRLGEFGEILGYHLEQAYRLRAELSPVDQRLAAVARAAAEHLSGAGGRAYDRGDSQAACNLLRRAAGLLTPGDPAVADIKGRLGRALIEAGMFEEADVALTEAASTSGDERIARLAIADRTWMYLLVYPERVALDQVRKEVEASIAVFTSLGDDDGLARSWLLLNEIHTQRCCLGAATEAAEHAVAHAHHARDARDEGYAVSVLALALDCGPQPVTEALERCRALLAKAEGRSYAVPLLGPLAHLEAMQRQFSVARDLIGRARSITEEVRLTWTPPWLAWWSGKVEFLAGDLIAAEREFRLGYALFQQMGEKNVLSSLVVELGEVLLLRGRDREAFRLTEVSRLAAGSDDIWSQILWRSLRARLMAHQGNLQEAEELAREAVGLATGIDYSNMQACALIALAEVLQLADRPRPAQELLKEAAALYQHKGNLASLATLQSMM
jgi:class 3 adenylate cyclase